MIGFCNRNDGNGQCDPLVIFLNHWLATSINPYSRHISHYYMRWSVLFAIILCFSLVEPLTFSSLVSAGLRASNAYGRRSRGVLHDRLSPHRDASLRRSLSYLRGDPQGTAVLYDSQPPPLHYPHTTDLHLSRWSVRYRSLWWT